MTRYREGSRAIFVNSAISSRKRGRLSASIIQPVQKHILLSDEETNRSTSSVGDLAQSKWGGTEKTDGFKQLTFHHDHIDIYGTDGWLRESLPLFQDAGYFAGRDPVVRFGPKCHQLPDCHT